MPKITSSVKALIFYQDKFLLLKEKLGDRVVWDLPGGKIEYGETPQEALKREIKEEIYADVKIGKSVGVWWFMDQREKRQIICHTFRCNLSKKIEIDFTHNPSDEEMVGFQWVNIEEFLSQKYDGLPESLKELVANL